ncbi:MAG: hypothetical protein ACOC1P_00370 [Minisyncoccales bacterium]
MTEYKKITFCFSNGTIDEFENIEVNEYNNIFCLKSCGKSILIYKSQLTKVLMEFEK